MKSHENERSWSILFRLSMWSQNAFLGTSSRLSNHVYWMGLWVGYFAFWVLFIPVSDTVRHWGEDVCSLLTVCVGDRHIDAFLIYRAVRYLENDLVHHMNQAAGKNTTLLIYSPFAESLSTSPRHHHIMLLIWWHIMHLTSLCTSLSPLTGSHRIGARCPGLERRNERDHRQIWKDEGRTRIAAQTKPSTSHENTSISSRI